MTAPHRTEPGPLLVTCALRIERFALGRGARPEDGTRILRTGMGPRAARRGVLRALSGESGVSGEGASVRTAVAATGFCAGLVPGMRPGDLVLAEEVRDGGTVVPCTGTAALTEALAPLGTLHTGTLAGTDHVVRGAERAALRRSGALAVDMESAATLGTAADTAPQRPVTAVRVVVDAPGHELLRVGTLGGGISAFRVLSTLLPALLAWHRSLQLPRR
ncbi:1-hydroxy-2-methyl-2-butenyl 4-diphosphate reductase [Streptomyces sp. TR06-5]|uniref:phosphorylase family protein n=1 Tax=unclassified Streptomyces TaxID=2593676 RepID=UPI0039A2E99C